MTFLTSQKMDFVNFILCASFCLMFLFVTDHNLAYAYTDTSLQVNRAKKTDPIPKAKLSNPKSTKKAQKKIKVAKPQALRKAERKAPVIKASQKNIAGPKAAVLNASIAKEKSIDLVKDVPIKKGLKNFYDALTKTLSGENQKPVTILHMGDDRIARDGFSSQIRKMLQSRFGDGGRGMVMPGPIFPFYRADGIQFKSSGRWEVKTALSGEGGPYGLTGAMLTSSDPKASLQMTSTGDPFSWAEVSLFTGPQQGRAIVWVQGPSGSHQQIIETKTLQHSIRRVRFPSQATSVSVFPEGERPITLLSWQSGHDRPGIRYVNLGMPKSTINLAQGLDAEFVKLDLNNVKPDLIVLSYGYNDGFNESIDSLSYEERFRQLIEILKTLAPNASVLVIGPPDGAMIPEYAKSGASTSSKACRALSKFETENYSQLVATRDSKLGRWYPPMKLDQVRQAMRRAAAKTSSFFWDWSLVMGGPCGIHAWVHNTPKLASDDHKNLTAAGTKESASRLYSELMSGFDAYRLLASR